MLPFIVTVVLLIAGSRVLIWLLEKSGTKMVFKPKPQQPGAKEAAKSSKKTFFGEYVFTHA